MARIGIMGGTFDPIHWGHLSIGRQARREWGLKEVWYMPSGQPPHKKDHQVTDGDKRCAMVKLALKGEEGLVFSDFELRRPGNTYTAQTLRLLRAAYPEHEFYFILGADSLYEIEQWYHPEQIMDKAVILAACREYSQSHPSLEAQIGCLAEKYGARIYRLHSREMDVSSKEIRDMVSDGREPKGLLPEAVLAYIREHGLYRREADSNNCQGGKK